ncbi:mitochondrial import inner membrane translocase subunit [Tuber indicum]|nr:mitochondrial import inner membrane translocase subunit [Tuber indicum]
MSRTSTGTSTGRPWGASVAMIVNDFGGAFCMGAIGGGIWHGARALRNGNTPLSVLQTIKSRAPISGGSFGIWGGVYSAFECGLKGVRNTEDPLNAVLSGFLTGGMLALRRGARAAGGSAVGGAALLAAVEGVGVGLDRAAVLGVLGGGGAAAGGLLKEVVAPENFTFC